MPTLHLHLQEGFQDDTVRVSVAGRTIWEGGPVSTRYQIGVAAIEEIELPSDSVTLRIEVSTRGAAADLTIRISQTPYLLVNLDASAQLRLGVTAEMPFYA